MSLFFVTEDEPRILNIPGTNFGATPPFILFSDIRVELSARDGVLSYAPQVSGVTVTGTGTRTLVISGLWIDVAFALSRQGPLYTPAANDSGDNADVITQTVSGAAVQHRPAPGTQIIQNDTIDVNIAPRPDDPNSLVLSGGTVAENAGVGAVVGRLTGTDPDAGATLRYVLFNGGGGAFAINEVTGEISVAAPLDFEAERFYNLVGGVIDETGRQRTLDFRVNVTNVNESTIAIIATPGLPGTTVFEIAPAGTVVGDVDAVDEDRPANTFIYSIIGVFDVRGFLVANEGRFVVDPLTGIVTIADPARLNIEQSRSYEILVRATTVTPEDSSGTATGDFAQIPVTLNLLDANRAPAGVDANFTIDPAGQRSITITTPSFDLGDAGDTLNSIVILSLPTRGLLVIAAPGQSLVFDGVTVTDARAVVVGDAISAAALAAGALTYRVALGEPSQSNYASFGFQVRDNGGTASGATDTDPTPNVVRIDTRSLTIVGGVDASGADDFNGDGFDDFIVRAVNQPGSPAYVIFGRDGGPGAIDLANLSPANGLSITAPGTIASVSGAGDVNGDGIGDVVIGVPGDFSNENAAQNVGAAYVVFGRAGISGPIDVATAGPSAAISIIGNDPIYPIGTAVARAGDVNGDGRGDVLIGTVDFFTGSSVTHLLFGRADGGSVDLADTAAVRRIETNTSSGTVGFTTSLAGVGDINADGFDDVTISLIHEDRPGSLFLAYGRADGALSPRNITDFTTTPNIRAGTVAYGGDFNGDGIDDFSFDATSGATDFQDYVLIFGQVEFFDLFNLVVGVGSDVTVSGPARVTIDDPGNNFGASAAGADLNDDGYSDIIVGQPGRTGVNSFSGSVSIVYGRGVAPVGYIPLNPTQVISSFAGARAGSHVAAIGDINRDGFADYIVQSGIGTGALSTIIFGRSLGVGDNRQPDLTVPLADQTARLNRAFAYTIPAGSFTDPDPGDVLSYSVTGLPAWLSFDAATRRFSGTPGGADLGRATVSLIVTDGVTAALRQTLTFTVTDPLGFTNGNDVRANPAGLDAEIDGLAGVDTLDMSGFTTAITLNTDAGGVATIDGFERVANVEVFILGRGNDVARTGGGSFAVRGGPGDDSYFDNDGNDTLIEDANGGTDIVYVGVSYILPDYFENLSYTGTGAATLTGNASNNAIDSGTGATGLVTLTGAGGDDTLIVRDGTNPVTVSGGVGNDTLVTERGVAVLPGDIENVFSTSTGDATLTGNAGDNGVTGGAGNDNINGGGGNDTLVSGAGNDTVATGAGTGLVFGGAGNDTLTITGIGGRLFGEGDNDTLDSGSATGFTELFGGDGDDTLILRAGTTGVGIAGGAGFDTLIIERDLAIIPDDIEAIVYAGTGNLTATGNAGNNRIDGGAGDDIIDGGDGDDLLIAGAGNDDVRGGLGRDLIGGRGGNDILRGGTGAANELVGDDGDDIFILEAVGDSVIEFANQGIDEIQTALAVMVNRLHVETLRFTDGTPHLGVGNAHDETIIGDTGRDDLFGRAGNDILHGGSGAANTLFGQSGDDTYIVSAAGDSVIEFAGEGTDTVQTGLAQFVLRADVENLEFTGTGAFTGIGAVGNNMITGGAGDDFLSGLSGDDKLIGGAGNDILIGGAGADEFAMSFIGTGVDRILDFTSGIDKISFDNRIVDQSENFILVQGAGAQPSTFDASFIYNTSTGRLSYDRDGAGASEAVLYAILNPGLTLAVGDFIIY